MGGALLLTHLQGKTTNKSSDCLGGRGPCHALESGYSVECCREKNHLPHAREIAYAYFRLCMFFNRPVSRSMLSPVVLCGSALRCTPSASLWPPALSLMPPRPRRPKPAWKETQRKNDRALDEAVVYARDSENLLPPKELKHALGTQNVRHTNALPGRRDMPRKLRSSKPSPERGRLTSTGFLQRRPENRTSSTRTSSNSKKKQ